MDATRARLSFEHDHFAEHLHPPAVTVLVVLALIVVSLLVREIRFAPRALTTSTAAASGAPAEVVSVATLVLAADRQIRVGDAKADTIARLASQTLVSRTEESGPFGAREIRAYAGFTLVFEPFERDGGPRVAAIYVQ
jgi:hypothetical protein